MTKLFLPQRAAIIQGIPPANYSSTAKDGDWVNMENYRQLVIIINCGAWASGTAAVTLNEALTDGGTEQALAFDYQYTNVADTSTDVLTQTAVASDTFNLSAANAQHVIVIDTEEMDRDDDYKWLQIAVASPGANADYYSVTYILTDPRYADATMPSAI